MKDDAYRIRLEVRPVENGLIANFGGDHDGIRGEIFVAMTGDEMRGVLMEEIGRRLSGYINSLTRS